MRLHCITLPNGKDPDDILQDAGGAELLSEMISKAPAWYEWLAGQMLCGAAAADDVVDVKAVHDYLSKIANLTSEVDTDVAIRAAADITGLKAAALRRELKAIRTGKTADGREMSSTDNGKAGGRPRNDYASYADSYMSARRKDDVFTRRFYRGAWRRYSKNRWIEVTNDDMTADITAWIRREHRDLSESRTLSNMVMNLMSVDTGHIMSSIEAPVWLEGNDTQPQGLQLQPGGPLITGIEADFDIDLVSAEGWMPMVNGLLNIPAALDVIECGDTLDCMPDGIFAEATPRLFSLHYLDYKFTPEARCPKFMEYLQDVQPDDEARAMIRCLMGLMLVPETRFNTFFILQGAAGTGKSVFLHVLDNLVGRHNVCTVPLPKLDDDHFTWQLTENLMNSIDDMREVNLRDVEGTIKIATDGGWLDIRRLYKDGGRAKVIARTVAACNVMPRVHEKSDAIWDRLRVVPFNTVIRGTGKQNSNLKYEIVKEELPGIFIWALGGLAELQDKHVFPEHPEGLASKDKHRGECDPTAVFLREYYEADPASQVDPTKIGTGEIYAHYKSWSHDNGYRQQAAGTLNRDIERVFDVKKKVIRFGPTGHTKTMQGFEGIRRNPETLVTQQYDDEFIPEG